MMCKICGSEDCSVIYNDVIRNGGIGVYTKNAVPMYCCNNCRVIWHENVIEDTEEYYESQEYRASVDGNSEAERFYQLHDKETLDKLNYTGTTIFRGKTVADIGCGAGAFLDYINGVADKIIAVEPSSFFREVMNKKGFTTYPYASDAIKDYKGKVDVVTSFDVIEHVEDPEAFLKDIYNLLSDNGSAIVATPTDAPVMRELIGTHYEKQVLYSVQHLWIFSQASLKLLAEKCGFKKIEVKTYQRYGIDNLFGWLINKKPLASAQSSIITQTMNNVWKTQCCDSDLGDYVVMYLEK